ncbi:PilW family protein [Thiocapsa sp.]|uniref:PilW family protein n=1 Tax=Thiocapsa sp. TaxID=2024551 RepID=UPI0025F2D84B|nr:PilW family protein [Thiocapsa sp.]
MDASFRQSGLTMVEILVALALGLFLTGGILSVYLGSKQTYRVVEALARSQENGRYAVELLGRTVRMAGYVGCARLDDSPNNIVKPEEDGDLSNGNFVDVDVDEVVAALRISGTDALVVRGGGGPMARLDAEKTWDANAKIDRNADDWSAGDVLIISDCLSVDIFRATNVSKDPNGKGITIAHAKNANTDNKLSKVYAKGADVMSYRETTFFVASSQADECVEPCRGLWRRLGNEDPQEILQGVENMQILYGIDTSGSRALDRYMTADEVDDADDWEHVVAVRIDLLLVSPEDNLVDSPRSIVFNGEELEPDDRRMRRVLTTTVAIRNRLP